MSRILLMKLIQSSFCSINLSIISNLFLNALRNISIAVFSRLAYFFISSPTIARSAVDTLHCVKRVRIRSYSGLHFSTFVLNTALRIESECVKLWTRITPNTDTFYAVVPKADDKNLGTFGIESFFFSLCLI